MEDLTGLGFSSCSCTSCDRCWIRRGVWGARPWHGLQRPQESLQGEVKELGVPLWHADVKLGRVRRPDGLLGKNLTLLKGRVSEHRAG